MGVIAGLRPDLRPAVLRPRLQSREELGADRSRSWTSFRTKVGCADLMLRSPSNSTAPANKRDRKNIASVRENVGGKTLNVDRRRFSNVPPYLRRNPCGTIGFFSQSHSSVDANRYVNFPCRLCDDWRLNFTAKTDPEAFQEGFGRLDSSRVCPPPRQQPPLHRIDEHILIVP